MNIYLATKQEIPMTLIIITAVLREKWFLWIEKNCSLITETKATWEIYEDVMECIFLKIVYIYSILDDIQLVLV